MNVVRCANVNTAQNAAMKWIKVSSQTATLQLMREMLGTLRLPANISSPGSQMQNKP
jgi:hypothetical protein